MSARFCSVGGSGSSSGSLPDAFFLEQGETFGTTLATAIGQDAVGSVQSFNLQFSILSHTASDCVHATVHFWWAFGSS